MITREHSEPRRESCGFDACERYSVIYSGPLSSIHRRDAVSKPRNIAQLVAKERRRHLGQMSRRRGAGARFYAYLWVFLHGQGSANPGTSTPLHHLPRFLQQEGFVLPGSSQWLALRLRKIIGPLACDRSQTDGRPDLSAMPFQVKPGRWVAVSCGDFELIRKMGS
jgi:hypothetical protein